MKTRFVIGILAAGHLLGSAPFVDAQTVRVDAAVVVEHLSDQVLQEGEDASSWRWVPAFLRGADIHSVGKDHKGVCDFNVTRSGTLYLAAHYGYEGNRSGGWTEDRLTLEDLVGQGWSHIAKMKHGNGRVFQVLRRDVEAGEHYRIRVNKYTPPYLITLNDKAGTLPSAETPWLRFGPVAVSDFTPRTLQPGIRGGRGVFEQVPASLRGMAIFSDVRRPHDGVLEFHVIEPTQVYMAGFWGYDGNNNGDWDEERLTFEDMTQQGWVHVEDMVQGNKRVYQVLTKVLQAGVTHRIRFNKYTPPHLILPQTAYRTPTLEGGEDKSVADYTKSLPRFSATSHAALTPKPVLWIERSGEAFTVQWHPSIPGSYLEKCTDLNNAQWEPVDGGATNPCRVAASDAQCYYRIVVPE